MCYLWFINRELKNDICSLSWKVAHKLLIFGEAATIFFNYSTCSKFLKYCFSVPRVRPRDNEFVKFWSIIAALGYNTEGTLLSNHNEQQCRNLIRRLLSAILPYTCVYKTTCPFFSKLILTFLPCQFYLHVKIIMRFPNRKTRLYGSGHQTASFGK